jgi:DNA-binding response OmpR family regulator
MTILIVDDSQDSRDIAEAALYDGGYDQLHSVGSAAEALDYLRVGHETGEPPHGVDLMLLDVVMPDMDGIALCARIRTDRRFDDVPILMLTSLEDAESLAHALAAGANDYLHKPVDRSALTAHVNAALKRKTRLDC